MTESTSPTSNRAGKSSEKEEEIPLVSVVITTYCRPSYLRKAVRSVLEQTYDSIELVVVDDHSEEPACEVLAGIDLSALADFQCIRHNDNRGANAARNTGVNAVSGEYIAFLDDDDQWVAEKIERQVEAFHEAGDDVGVVYCGVESINSNGKGEEIPPPIEGDITKPLLCRNVVGSMSVIMVKTTVARDVTFDEEFPAWADLEWYIRLSQQTRFKRLPEPLTVYEYTSHGRLSDDFEKKRRSYEEFVDRFGSIAVEYGHTFRRKMYAWAAFRLGKSALQTGHYRSARQLFATAIASYPFDSIFIKYFLASVGGPFTHKIAKKLNSATL